VPEEERRHDPGDQPEDEVGLAEMAPGEAPGPQHLADEERTGDAGEHERREDVDEQDEPPLAREPRQRRAVGQAVLAGDHADHGDEDRGEEDDEAPEDGRMDEAGAETLQQLPLAEHDHRLVAEPAGHVVEPRRRRPHPHEPDEEERAPREEAARDHERRREENGARGLHYRRSSSTMAGTISCRSPTTA
jgi:hypothetical protein